MLPDTENVSLVALPESVKSKRASGPKTEGTAEFHRSIVRWPDKPLPVWTKLLLYR